MVKALEKEFKYYLDHQDELVKEYDGKFIVIHGSKVVGAYESELDAIKETSKKYKQGTFLLQMCEPGNSSYTQTYHSRVAFV
jgi:hypothetical protein